MRRFPRAKDFLDLLEHGVRDKITDNDEQRFGGNVVGAIEVGELIARESGELLFGGRDDGIGMLAEEHSAKAFAGEKSWRSALDSQFLEALAALALELIFGKRGVAREVGHQLEDAGRKFGETGRGNRAGIGSGVRAEASAHAAQILFNAAARARGGSGANDCGRHFSEAGCGVRDDGVPAAEIKLR